MTAQIEYLSNATLCSYIIAVDWSVMKPDNGYDESGSGVEWQEWGSPCEIISPGAVWGLTAGQRREAAGGDVIAGAGDTGRAVGIYGQGFTITQCTQLHKKNK